MPIAPSSMSNVPPLTAPPPRLSVIVAPAEGLLVLPITRVPLPGRAENEAVAETVIAVLPRLAGSGDGKRAAVDVRRSAISVRAAESDRANAGFRKSDDASARIAIDGDHAAEVAAGSVAIADGQCRRSASMLRIVLAAPVSRPTPSETPLRSSVPPPSCSELFMEPRVPVPLSCKVPAP